MKNKKILKNNMSRREMMKYGFYTTLAMGFSGSFCLGKSVKKGSGKRPSIILISVDTLRPDHLGCYGYNRKTSPNIDQFANEALLFENCLSHAGDTRMSFASMLSGFLPHETKIIESIRLLEGVEMIAEIIQSQGYKTAAVISNFVLRKSMGFAQGFMIYDATMKERELVRHWPERIAQNTTDRAIELLQEFQKDELFMWIHYQDPHGPYTPPEPFSKMFQNPEQKPRNIKVNKSLSGRGGIPSYQKLGKNRDYHYYVSQYDAEIRYQDEHFKRLIEVLKELGLYDEAFIIFTSDHGEGMGEHDYYFAHGENLYSSQTHVPLIIRHGSNYTGRRKDFVQHLDIVPTLFNLLGMKKNPRFRGRDLFEKQGEKREIFSEMDSPLVKDRFKFSIVLDGLKLIHTPLNQEYELFDLKTDPFEKNNIIYDSQYYGRFKYLKKRLMRLRQEDFLALKIVEKPKKLTEEEKKKLRSLGYIR